MPRLLGKLLCKLGFHKWGSWHFPKDCTSAPKNYSAFRFCRRTDCLDIEHATIIAGEKIESWRLE